MSRHISVFEVPTVAGTHWSGLNQGPQAVREAGFQEKLSKFSLVETHNVLPDTPWKPYPLKDGVRDEDRALNVLQRLQEYLDANLSAKSFPVVVGGPCLITPAIMASVTRRSESIGFLYVDNDADLSLPVESSSRGASGIIDSMTVSSLTQREGCLESMKQFCRPDGSPTVTANNAVLFGIDITGPKPEHFEYLLDNHFRVFSSTAVHNAPKARAEDALAWLEPRVDRIWLHFDVDVIDSAEFPLGNFPSYGGISFDELMTAMECFLINKMVCGLSITDINPNNDPDRSMIGRLVERLVRAFERRLSLEA